MRVRAIADGFYRGRRRAGAVFEVEDGAKARWFEAVDAPAPVEKAALAVPKKPRLKTKPTAEDDLA